MVFMGTVYSWSVFRVEVETLYGVNTVLSGLPYMLSLFFYAMSMMVTGRFMHEKNTRLIAAIGIVFISLGWGLASYATSLFLLSISYGVLIGIGVGMVYGIPVFIINRQYQNSGVLTGIVLLGFGVSPLFSAPYVHYLISVIGLTETFSRLAMLTLILLPLVFMFTVKQPLQKQKIQSVNLFTPNVFVLLYGIFLIGTTIGLMMIGLSYRIGVINYGFNGGRVALALSVFALLNGLARPLFGWIVDRKGFVYAARLSAGLIVIAAVFALINQGNHIILYGLSMGLFWFNLGAFLAMLPASIKQFYGANLYAKRYGLMFTAYGFGAIIGTIFSGVLLDFFHHTATIYGLSIVMIGIMLALLRRINGFIMLQKP